ncbi:hypothetical protein BGX29_001040 [Mortierella sp. GBA35]|nr:hypothetical protein BGX29_001040 [Mortierella sp. GBA35]
MIATLMSTALTDKETEKVIAGLSKFPDFQERLHRLSSLQKLHLEILQRDKWASKCKHEGKTRTLNVARGFFRTWTVAYVVKYLIGVLPALLAGKAFKKDAVESSGKEQALVTTSGWGDILAKTISLSAATVLMASTSSVNIYATIIESDTVPKSYWKFLMHHTGMPQKFGILVYPLMDGVRSQFSLLRDLSAGAENIGIPAGITSRDFVSANISPNLATVYPSVIHHNFQLCALLHPTTQCSGHAADVVTGEFRRTFKMYSTLNIILALVFQHKRLTTQPKEVVQRFIISTTRSSLFLTISHGIAMYSLCLMRRIFKKERTFLYLVNGFFAGGLGVLFEQPGRRMELALYCLPRALETGWRILLKRGLVRRILHWDITLFSASMGVMMTIYQNDPSVINKHYLTVLTRVSGRN